jgi:hypothetical protein
MKKEYTVHFKVIRKQNVQHLRGLIYLEENQAPTLQDFEECLRECGYEQLQLEDPQHVIFRAYEPEGAFLIDVLEDYDANRPDRDLGLEALAKTFFEGK